MNQNLVHLYELQKVDSQLDELLESRGELPERVREMRETMEAQAEELTNVRERVKEIEGRSGSMAGESTELRDKIEKYKGQQFDVKTTREYDAITYQLDDAQKRMNTNLQEVSRMGIEAEQLRNEEERVSVELEAMKTDLKEAEVLLEEVMRETKEEEEKLRHRRDELLPTITPYFLNIYNRVRPAKQGVAVVAVRNGVCGGCFNAIPRQLVLDLNKGEKNTVCEYCGRIVVGEPIAIHVDGEPVPVTYEMDSEDEQESGNGDE
ncbi:MAG TPA: C4-type zinc ribbon domain-containing protein [Candidatus Kapabacteria bacterium]|nr:C4-type zinc ribbon domain-containing protein [Candidatus Kapabacteria bacterium]